MRILIDKRPYNQSFDVFMLEGFGCKARPVLPLTLGETRKMFSSLEPTFSITQTEAQELMDSLWQAGIRPSEGTGSAGQLAATQKHLDDMRKLVFGNKEKNDLSLLSALEPVR